MRPTYTALPGMLLLSGCFYLPSDAQCTISSSCGYNVSLYVKTINVVPSSMSCPYGYNYNISFAYTITVDGSNNCYNGDVGFQPQIFCNSGQNNGYYTINVAAPTVGAPPAVSKSSGTLTTSTNPYNSNTDCATSTPASLGCTSMQVTIYGPGLPTTTYPCNFSVLPIELKYFTASLGTNEVLLKWTTASEKNNAFFSVERSTDGGSWTQTDLVKGGGTRLVTTDYESRDKGFARSTNYYRLKQTDLDGSFNYSYIVAVDATQMPEKIRYYPNPAGNSLTVETGSTTRKEVYLYTSLDEPVAAFEMEQQTQLDLSLLPAGVYILKLKEETKEQYMKLIKN